MITVDTQVAIVGGGPTGLMLAIELGRRGVPCVLIEQNPAPRAFPKANSTSARTMEHYRRHGFADEVRALGLPDDHPQDIVYCTRLAAHELARFRGPSRRDFVERRSFGDFGEQAWPTPELPHRAQQMFIEPLLKRKAEECACASVRFGQRLTAIQEQGDGVELDVEPADGGSPWRLHAAYAVAADGPRSLVRKALGIEYTGLAPGDRDFMSGQMLSTYFRSRDLYGRIAKPRAWQYWAVNGEQRCLLISLDGIDRFALMVQLAPGQAPESLDFRRAAFAAVGAEFDIELIGAQPWIAGYALVAQSFRAGRIFLAGDAAHLFTPTAGLGYNTGVEDAVNLGWKLAAACQGWGGVGLLDSYEVERKAIAHRNTGFARRMADSIGGVPILPDLEKPGAGGEAARAELGRRLLAHVHAEFNIPGINLGVSYAGSPIVAREDGPPPADDPHRYLPTAHPGARAPHAWIGDGVSLFDRFGYGFAILALNGGDPAPWERAAAAAGIPLRSLRLDSSEARALYGADFALIRPDHHVAWRGDRAADIAGLLARCTGRRLS